MTAAGAVCLTRFSRRFSVPVVSVDPDEYSTLPIDIVIPVIDKDSETLPYVVDSVRENVKHPIGEVFFVCPGDSVQVRRVAKEKGCIIVDERELLPVSPKDINYVSHGKNRSGWLYQQFLKWSGAKFCSHRYYLVADSDTVFARPQVFEIEGRIVFDVCDGVHKPYFDAYEKIFGSRPESGISFTSHHALIDVEMIKTMIAEIENMHGMPWYDAIIRSIDINETSSVSDYDNYGQFVLSKTPERMIVRYWRNLSLYRRDLDKDRAHRAIATKRYLTLSFHAYNT